MYHHSGAHSLAPVPATREATAMRSPLAATKTWHSQKKRIKKKYRRSWEARSWDLQSRDTAAVSTLRYRTITAFMHRKGTKPTFWEHQLRK